MIKAAMKGTLGKFAMDLEFELPLQGVTALFGKSGAGKTSLLRWMAGLGPRHNGLLIFNDKVWQDSTQNIYLPTHKRGIGYVFQEPSLFSHLNVGKNLQYGFTRNSSSSSENSFQETIELLGIRNLLSRMPEQLSGGEKQRVAMARALLSQPDILLLDEPLAALDAGSKKEILPYLKKLKHELRIPIFYISHSVEEIKELADRVLEIDDGRIVRHLPINNFKSSAKDLINGPIMISVSDDINQQVVKDLQVNGYKVGNFNEDSVKEILNQHFSNFDVVIVDKKWSPEELNDYKSVVEKIQRKP